MSEFWGRDEITIKVASNGFVCTSVNSGDRPVIMSNKEDVIKAVAGWMLDIGDDGHGKDIDIESIKLKK